MHRPSVAIGAAAYLLGMASLVAADAPSVDIVALPTTDCSHYPLYNATDNTAGPWIIIADSTGNPSVDGHGDTTAYARDYMPLSWGSLVILADNSYAKYTLQCSGGSLEAYVNTYTSDCLPYCTKPLPDSPSDSQPAVWAPVVLSSVQGNIPVFHGELTVPILPFQHVVDGKVQDGVYLGSGSNSTWGFTATTNTRGQSVYSIRVLDSTTELYDGEFTGFIKIDA